MPNLMAISGSSRDEVTLGFGARTAHQTDERPVVLTVIGHEADRDRGEALLAGARERLAAQGIDAETRLRLGHAATEIVREAQEGGYGLLVVGGCQEQHLMRRLLHGSTVVRAVEHAPCPVIVAKGQARSLQRVLLCDSGATNSSAGLNTLPLREGAKPPTLLSRFLEQTPALLGAEAEITVLHVMSQMSAGPGVRGKQLRSNAQELIAQETPEGHLLDEHVGALAQLGLRARARVRHGLVVDEILAEAKEGGYDLVVIGAFRGEGWQRILLDDQAHKIIVEMDRPVMVLR